MGDMNHRHSDVAGDAYPNEEPQAENDARPTVQPLAPRPDYTHSEPSSEPVQYDWVVVGKDQVLIHPTAGHRLMLEMANHSHFSRPHATGKLHLFDRWDAEFELLSSNMNLDLVTKALKKAAKQYGWEFKGLVDESGLPHSEKVASSESSCILGDDIGSRPREGGPDERDEDLHGVAARGEAPGGRRGLDAGDARRGADAGDHSVSAGRAYGGMGSGSSGVGDPLPVRGDMEDGGELASLPLVRHAVGPVGDGSSGPGFLDQALAAEAELSEINWRGISPDLGGPEIAKRLGLTPTRRAGTGHFVYVWTDPMGNGHSFTAGSGAHGLRKDGERTLKTLRQCMTPGGACRHGFQWKTQLDSLVDASMAEHADEQWPPVPGQQVTIDGRTVQVDSIEGDIADAYNQQGRFYIDIPNRRFAKVKRGMAADFGEDSTTALSVGYHQTNKPLARIMAEGLVQDPPKRNYPNMPTGVYVWSDPQQAQGWGAGKSRTLLKLDLTGLPVEVDEASGLGAGHTAYRVLADVSPDRIEPIDTVEKLRALRTSSALGEDSNGVKDWRNKEWAGTDQFDQMPPPGWDDAPDEDDLKSGTYSCPDCDKTFADYGSWRKHVADEHLKRDPLPSEVDPYVNMDATFPAHFMEQQRSQDQLGVTAGLQDVPADLADTWWHVSESPKLDLSPDHQHWQDVAGAGAGALYVSHDPQHWMSVLHRSGGFLHRIHCPATVVKDMGGSQFTIPAERLGDARVIGTWPAAAAIGHETDLSSMSDDEYDAREAPDDWRWLPEEQRNFLESEAGRKIAMPWANNVWYHVTHRDSLPSIKDHGLVPTGHGMGNSKNWDEFSIVTGGVYLWPTISAAESNYRSNAVNPLTNSTGWRADDLVVLQIANLDRRRLHPDPEMMSRTWEDTFGEYVNDPAEWREDWPEAEGLVPWFEAVGHVDNLDYSGQPAWAAYMSLTEQQREAVKEQYGMLASEAWVYLGTIPAQAISLAQHPGEEWGGHEELQSEMHDTYMDDDTDYAADQYRYQPIVPGGRVSSAIDVVVTDDTTHDEDGDPNEQRKTFHAVVNGEQAGHLEVIEEAPGQWMVYDVWVNEEYRRQGIATQLLDEARAQLGNVRHADEESLTDDGKGWSTVTAGETND